MSARPTTEAGAWVDGRPAHEALAPGVERLALRVPTLPPATATNALIVGTEELVVVEPAAADPRALAPLVAALDRRCAAGARLRAVVVTHHHADHVGGVAALRDRYAVEAYGTAEVAARRPELGLAVIDESFELALAGGETLVPLATPGHAPGHVVWLERRSAILHGGDLVAGLGTVLIDPDDGGDLAAYLASLEGLAERLAAGSSGRAGTLDFAAPPRIVPAHGPVIDDPVETLRRYVEHRQMRERKLIAALGPGRRRLTELVAAVYDDVPQALWPLARKSLRAHLNKLTAEGRAVADGPGYRLA